MDYFNSENFASLKKQKSSIVNQPINETADQFKSKKETQSLIMRVIECHKGPVKIFHDWKQETRTEILKISAWYLEKVREATNEILATLS